MKRVWVHGCVPPQYPLQIRSRMSYIPIGSCHSKQVDPSPLSNMFTQVPQLATSCIAALTNPECPGSGLRTLRLTSKEMRIVVLDHVQGCTLQLDGVGAEMVPQMTVMKGVDLKRLNVAIMPGNCIGLRGWEAHKLQFDSFVAVMATAIRSVTHLEITSWGLDSAPDSFADMNTTLNQLASLCPALTHLWIDGPPNASMLRVFGSACSGIRTLKVTMGRWCQRNVSTHIGLDCHMSGVQSLELVTCENEYSAIMYNTDGMYLLSGIHTSITAPDLIIGHNSWRYLPSELRHLECCMRHPLKPDARLMPCLTSLKVHAFDCQYQADLETLVSILRRAPLLSNIELVSIPGRRFDEQTYLQLMCSPTARASLEYLEGRVSDGLLILPGGDLNVMLVGGDAADPGELSEEDEDDVYAPMVTDGSISICDFMESLSRPLFAVRRLILDEERMSLPTTFATILPNITSLVISSSSVLYDQELRLLCRLKALERLSLAVKGGTRYDFIQLCLICVMMLPTSLRLLRAHHDPDLHDDDTEALATFQERLDEWGLTVQVDVITDGRCVWWNSDGPDHVVCTEDNEASVLA